MHHRYEGLVDYIADTYRWAAEIGIGPFPDVAWVLAGVGVRVFATDIRPFQHQGLKVLVDDITQPDVSLYTGVDLIYSLRPPSELVPYMERLAREVEATLIVKPLASEYLEGQLTRRGSTTFFLWSHL